MKHRVFCERFMAALRRRDTATLSEMLHPDFVVEEAESLPYGGTFRGIDGWLELSRAVIGAWAGFEIRPIEYPGETKESFVVRFAISGRSRKTGKAFDTTVLELWHFAEDKLIRIDPYYFDTHALVMADSP